MVEGEDTSKSCAVSHLGSIADHALTASGYLASQGHIQALCAAADDGPERVMGQCE